MIRTPGYWKWALDHERFSKPTVESTSRGFGPGGKLTEAIRELAGDLMTPSDYRRVAYALLDET